jgi:hypothetical protein
MYHIHFFIKRLKKKEGRVPVYCRLTIHKERAEFSTNTRISEKDWANKKYNFSPIQTKVQNLYEQLIGNGDVSAMQLRAAFKGTKPKYLLNVFSSHLKEIKLLEQEFTLSTYNCYKRAYELLKDFIQKNYHSNDLPLTKVNYTFITKFDFHLKTSLKLANNTIVKYMARLKKIIRLALAHRFDLKLPISNGLIHVNSNASLRKNSP